MKVNQVQFIKLIINRSLKTYMIQSIHTGPGNYI